MRAQSGRFNITTIIVINVLFAIAIIGAIIMTFSYTNRISDAQNVENIRTMTESSAEKIKIAVDGHAKHVLNAANFINNKDGGMTFDEVCKYFESHYDPVEYNWQIVDSLITITELESTSGFLAKCITPEGVHTSVYNAYKYSELVKPFGTASDSNIGNIDYSHEFTDTFSLDKSFAITTTIRIKTDDGPGNIYKTLMLVVRSKNATEIIESAITDDPDQIDFSNVVVDKSGNYVISNTRFQGTNFIRTIEAYNEGFKKENKEKLLSQLASDEEIEPIYYDNIRGQKSIYTLCPIKGTDWYVLSLVPVSTFVDANTGYGYYALVALLVLLLIADVSYCIVVNRRLRTSLDKTEQAVEEAIRANMSKSSFLSRMSHEIRTPLNAIIGYNTIARNVMADANTETERRQAEMKTIDCLEKSGIASKHLLTVINDILDMSSIESGKVKVVMDRFDFKGMITSLSTVFYSQAREKGVDFEVVFDDLTDEWFFGDQMRTNQILTNLLSNAIKFTSSGGSVVMRITQPEVVGNTSRMHFEIVDTGIGMTEEYMSHALF